MRATLAIIRRELGSFFQSAMAPAVLTGFLVAMGLFFAIFLFGYSDMSLAAIQSPRSGNYMNLAEGLFRPLVSNTVFFLLFLMPALTMRLFAPEISSGRFDLLSSWPVPDHVWVVGKWAGATLAAGVMILCGAAYMGVVWFLGTPELGPALTSITGQLLFVSCLAAWGLLFSSLSRHQMAAYFLAFLVFILLFIIGALERFLPGVLGTVCRELSILNHFEKFTRGVIDSRDLTYFVLMTAVPLLAATAAITGRRMPGGRRFLQWIPTLLGVGLALVIYILGMSWSEAWDFTGNKRYSLAPQTLRVLDDLPEHLAGRRAAADSLGVSVDGLDHVMIRAFYERMDPAREITEQLLKACSQQSSKFRYEILDPNTELELLRKYRVQASRTIVVSVGDRFTSVLQPEESALISAVYRLATGKLARICHLLGHGEHLPSSDERGGYSTFDLVLNDQGYDFRPLHLGDSAGRVPTACDVLVIAGPRIDPEPGDIQAIEDHLARGGSVLALFDPPTPPGWTDWMARWKIGLTGNVLIAVDRMQSPRGISARTIVVDEGYGDHEVTFSMRGMPTVFPLVQALEQVGEPDSTVAGAVILQSSDQTWGETDDATRYTEKPSFNIGVDPKGPLPFGMVLELTLGDEETPPGRMVVIGNSEFLNNANINLAGNRDLLLNALGWLAREEGLIAIRGRDPLSQPVVLSDQAQTVLGWGSVLGWPLFVGSLATVFMLNRRRERNVQP